MIASRIELLAIGYFVIEWQYSCAIVSRRLVFHPSVPVMNMFIVLVHGQYPLTPFILFFTNSEKQGNTLTYVTVCGLLVTFSLWHFFMVWITIFFISVWSNGMGFTFPSGSIFSSKCILSAFLVFQPAYPLPDFCTFLRISSSARLPCDRVSIICIFIFGAPLKVQGEIQNAQICIWAFAAPLRSNGADLLFYSKFAEKSKKLCFFVFSPSFCQWAKGWCREREFPKEAHLPLKTMALRRKAKVAFQDLTERLRVCQARKNPSGFFQGSRGRSPLFRTAVYRFRACHPSMELHLAIAIWPLD